MEGKRSFVRQEGIARRTSSGGASEHERREGGKEGERARWQPTRPRRESETFCLSRRRRGRRHRRGNACATPSPRPSPARSFSQRCTGNKRLAIRMGVERGRQLVTIPVLKSCVLGNGTEWMHAPPRPASRVPEDYILCRRNPGRGRGKEAGKAHL